MKQIVIAALACLGVCWPEACRADGTATDAQQLEGVWKSKPPAKGRGRGHVLYIQGGKLGWESFQTRDGQPVIGHTKLYAFALDSKAAPKKITLTHGKGEDRITLLGVYELDADTLKIAVGSPSDKVAPKSVADDDAETVVLTRDKEAKVPKLDAPEGEDIRIRPIVQWAGITREPELLKKCPDAPVVSHNEFETVWKVLRGDELIPKVDFNNAFVLVRKGGLGGFPLIETGITLDAAGELGTMAAIGPEKVDGSSYVIAVFQRDVVDVVDGKLVAKKRK